MNKSILIVDTPPNCEECELLQHASFCYTGKNVNCYREDGKPKWCPLRPLPQKMTMEKALKMERCGAIKDIYTTWDACLDEITGETE